ncbi:hypothetical protein [Dyadobacter psychrotolerans]|uniref:Beta-lactamase-inhibitor-like PepSY-like domain-containing protein n=1 Tax=Dyadobacter psychrotolerans TaxID=2541721 RepID=A0A4R5DWM4_9BACT|nr:hypothetical protein [Dyadobacter psychrotolerans]TDE15433.1 hypothetical protein E0F88_13045 [Dyadobacter psychrotolerans]
MKKLITSALAITLISFVSVEAITPEGGSNVVAEHNVSVNLQEKVSVKPENLPEGVKKTVKGEAFAGWKIISAFLVTAEDKSQYYELNVKNGSESARVKLDKNGNNVE